MQVFEDKVTKTKHKYAGIWKRTFARIFDFILISVISFILFILCFIGQLKQLFSKFNPSTQLDTWRVCLATSFATILLFLYFYVIPYITKGYTLFKKVFKIRLHSNDRHRNFFWLIFKHEFMLSFFPIIFNIILIILIGVSNDPIKVVKLVSSITFDNETINLIKSNYFISIPAFIIKAGYILSGFLPLVLMFYMWFNKNKRSLQDKFSQTFVYELEEYKPNVIIQKQNIAIDDDTQLAPGLTKEIPESKLINNQTELSVVNDDFLTSCEQRSLLNDLDERRKELEKME